ncbi:hypothetical protein NFHSH190041_19130 [Shewanella sp. NFH-SH190041]|uniref:imm11 family protein n=1 Tax=Shewanella sp. NFH-SH190041 TaxID=2950245 RepID=UPI0021C474A4|nr:DUF1629 domain-containing protein [Shewanella sp. NFH-SH190041]BDM64461.1 hypothetical protein NFHSH190041_19130 [Shewanella sp. NFH-SH190041]
MYYVLKCDPDFSLVKYLDWLNIGECDFSPKQSEPWLKNKNFKLILSLQEYQEKKLSDCFFCSILTLISQDFKNVLKKHSSQIEFVPASIWCGEYEFNFYAMHMLNHLDALDIEKSIFAEVKFKRIAGITSLVLKEDKINNSKVFMLKNTYTSIFIVSDEFVRDVEKANLKGMKFIPVNEYRENVQGVSIT